MVLLKHLEPLRLDKLNLLDSRGSIISKTGCPEVHVIVRMQCFYRLSTAKNISGGRTTSRQATPLGDGRGIPKHFRNFGRFSKRSIDSSSSKHPSPLLAGFALRSWSTPTVLSSRTPDSSVHLHLLLSSSHRLLAIISADCAKMDPSDSSPAQDLLHLFADALFEVGAPQVEPGMPEISDEEVSSFLKELGEIHTPELSIPEETPSTLDTPVFNLLQPQHPTSPTPAAAPLASSPPPPPAPLPLVLPAPPLLLPGLQLRQVGPNTFEVVTPSLVLPLIGPLPLPSPSSPEDQGYSSPPSSPAPAPALAPAPAPAPASATAPESSEQRRLREQAEACRRYRENRKRKKEEEQREVEELERRNRELRVRAEAMEGMVDRLREVVMGGIKRESEGEEEGGKRRRK